jgi:hypothetical protein
MSEQDGPKRGREPRLRDFARRVLGDDDERSINARDVLGVVLDSGDKAKSELVRLVAREVRNYLEELGLHEDVRHLLTNYSLDVNASFSLKPLVNAVDEVAGEAAEE